MRFLMDRNKGTDLWTPSDENYFYKYCDTWGVEHEADEVLHAWKPHSKEEKLSKRRVKFILVCLMRKERVLHDQLRSTMGAGIWFLIFVFIFWIGVSHKRIE